MGRGGSARGGDESSTIATRLLEERRARDMSVRELGRLAGVTASLISQIENGKVNPSVGTLYRMAEALGIRVDEFFAGGRTGEQGPSGAGAERASGKAKTKGAAKPGDGAKASGAAKGSGEAAGRRRGRGRAAAADRQDRSGKASTEATEGAAADLSTAPETRARARADAASGPLSQRVVRPSSRNRIALAGGVQWELLTSPEEAAIEDIEVIKATYPPGSESSNEPMRHHGREYGLVLEGRLQLEVAGEHVTMEPGDSITFDSMKPHRLSNTGDVDTVTIWTVHGRRGADRDA